MTLVSSEMFLFKIIAISLMFYIKGRAELWDPPNQGVELTCKDSLSGIISTELSCRQNSKHITDVVVYNEKSILFKTKENLNNRKQMINDNLKTYFIVAAVVTLLFSIGYCKYQNGAHENHLLTLLANKEQSLSIAQVELCKLKEQNTEATLIVIEIHSLLSSVLEPSTKNNENLHAVKAKLVEYENLITELTQKNFEKTMELENQCEVIKNYEVTTDELTQKQSQLFEENDKLASQLEEIIVKNTLKESKMLKQMKSLELELDKKNSALIMAENEATLSKKTLEDMLSQKFNLADAEKMMNSIKATAELKLSKHMCEQYQCKLDQYAQSNQQIQMLKKEITDQEASYKKLLLAAEIKGSDHWFLFRQSEKKLKQMKLESAQLKKVLTISAKKHENDTIINIETSEEFEEFPGIPFPTVAPEFPLLDFEPPPPLIPSYLHLASTDQQLPPIQRPRRINRSKSFASPTFRHLPRRYNLSI